MGDTIITIVAIFLVAILMFVFPLMSISERNDDISQLGVQTATVEFVNDVRSTGKITSERYKAYLSTLAATGNSYDVEIEAKILDENPGKKAAAVDATKIGENIYYSVYTSQIESEIGRSNVYKLKEGDMVSVSVKNTNTTISQMLKNFFYTMSGNTSYKVAAQHAGIVLTTAN